MLAFSHNTTQSTDSIAPLTGPLGSDHRHVSATLLQASQEHGRANGWGIMRLEIWQQLPYDFDVKVMSVRSTRWRNTLRAEDTMVMQPSLWGTHASQWVVSLCLECNSPPIPWVAGRFGGLAGSRS